MQREIRRRRAKEKRRIKRIKRHHPHHHTTPISTTPITTPINNQTIGLVGFVIGQLSDVMVLQSIVMILLIVLIVSFSWNNILNQGIKKVGRIEFTTDEFLGKGCLGTSVFRGTFDGRNVAVKVGKNLKKNIAKKIQKLLGT